jgi:GNAT superfamily N-acetyltransferase
MDPLNRVHGEYELSTDASRIDWVRVHGWLSSSYWTPGISLKRVQTAGLNSALLVGAYNKLGQVGFARVISDKARFAYLCDVWVEESHRGKGLGRAMVKMALEHPELSQVSWLLATKDAHGVYARLGFQPLKEPARWMSLGEFRPDS